MKANVQVSMSIASLVVLCLVAIVLPEVWKPALPVRPANTIDLGSLLASILFVLARLAWPVTAAGRPIINLWPIPGENKVLKRWSDLTCSMGPVKWDFTTSWASTLTALAAIVTTVISSQDKIIPNPPPSSNPKISPNVDLGVSGLIAQYLGVSLLCGSLVVIAAFVYNATRHPKAPDVPATSGTEPQYEGFVATFLVASTITLWALTGELVLLLHIIQKVIDRRVLSGNTMIPIEMLVVYRCVVVLTLAVMAYYGWVSIRRTIEEQMNALQTREALRTMREGAASQPEERRVEAEQMVSDIAVALQPGASRTPGVAAVQGFRQRVLPQIEPDKQEQATTSVDRVEKALSAGGAQQPLPTWSLL